MSSRTSRPARFGPFHRRCEAHPEEVNKVRASGEVWGRPRRNFFAGLIPAVKAWEGPLPMDAVGIEFYTDVAPDPWSVPGWPEWTEGQNASSFASPGSWSRFRLLLPWSENPSELCEPQNLTS